MFTASMIEYSVNPETKITTASVRGIKNDAIDTLLKFFRKQNLILSSFETSFRAPFVCDEKGNLTCAPVSPNEIEMTAIDLTNCNRYLLPDYLEAHAKYDPNDPNPYNEERGKEIARRRLYNKYNREYAKAIAGIAQAVSDSFDELIHTNAITEERMMAFKYFEYYDVFKEHMNFDK